MWNSNSKPKVRNAEHPVVFLMKYLLLGAGGMSEITTHSIALSLAAAGLACWCGAGGAGLVGFEGCSLGITALCASGIAFVCSGRSWSADGRRRNLFAGAQLKPLCPQVSCTHPVHTQAEFVSYAQVRRRWAAP